jgi:hypothetical protein
MALVFVGVTVGYYLVFMYTVKNLPSKMQVLINMAMQISKLLTNEDTFFTHSITNALRFF